MSADLKKSLCEEFCGSLSVTKVPAGYAVGTGYGAADGDLLGFYVVGPDGDGRFRLEDDGMSIPMMEAKGVDLSSKTRQEAFNSLMSEYNVIFDDESRELMTDPLKELDVASAAMRFLSFLLRVQDLVLLSQEKLANTFREDALSLVFQKLEGKAELIENHAVHEDLSEFAADVAIFAPERPAVALFIGSTESRVYEALLLQSHAERKEIPCSVVAMLEDQKSVSQKHFARATNHLDAVPLFRGHEEDAINRLNKEVFGKALLH
ncbi:MAG: DUF1828 domain-containing protein [Pseudomonadota bacterium]